MSQGGGEDSKLVFTDGLSLAGGTSSAGDHGTARRSLAPPSVDRGDKNIESIARHCVYGGVFAPIIIGWRLAFWRVVAGISLWLAVVPVSSVVAKETHTAQAEALFTGQENLRLSIEIAEPEMELLRTQKRTGASAAIRTDVNVTVREGGHLYSKVGLHLKGSASFRGVDVRPALTLSFDHEDPKQRFHGLQKISLNNSAQDPSLLNELLGRELFNAAGLPAPRVTHVRVELNGRDLGVYLLVEGWNKQFLKRHFADPAGNLYEKGAGREVNAKLAVKSGDAPTDHHALNALAAAAQEPNPLKRQAALERTLDLDRFITGMALETMIGHWDGYCGNQNNFRIFHDRAKNRMVFMPHGMDQLFSGRRSPAVFPPMKGLVAMAVLDTPEGRRHYVERLDDLCAKSFNVLALANRVAEVAARLQPLMADDPAVLREHQGAVKRLVARMAQQHESVTRQLALLKTPLPPDGREVVALPRWDSWRESGNPSFVKKEKVGRDILQIDAAPYGSEKNKYPGNAVVLECIGAWRATYLLEPGRYRFTGRGMAENTARVTNAPAGRIGLRTSESSNTVSYVAAPIWTNLTHEFTVPAKGYVDLICEYRGSKGRASFVPETLVLERLADTIRRPVTTGRRGALDKP